MALVIVESGEPREVHHFATSARLWCLCNQPISGTLRRSREHGRQRICWTRISMRQSDDYNQRSPAAVSSRSHRRWVSLRCSLIRGLRSSRQSVSVSRNVIEKYFTRNTVSRVGGIGLWKISQAQRGGTALSRHLTRLACNTNLSLESVGCTQDAKSGERSICTIRQTIHLLQEATWTGSYDLFKQYSAAG